MNKENEYAIITIQNAPSRTELIFLLNSFLTQSNYPKNYRWENRSDTVDLIFSNPLIASDFLKRLMKEKHRNDLYAKASFSLSTKCNDHGFPITKLNHNNSFTGLPLSIREKLVSSKLSKRTLSSSLISSPFGSYSQFTLRDIKGKAGIISTSSPYKSINDVIIEEEKVNRKKWISNQNFKLYVGKRSMNIANSVKNYVQISPSIPPVNYLFRGLNKDKWINNEGFKL